MQRPSRPPPIHTHTPRFSTPTLHVINLFKYGFLSFHLAIMPILVIHNIWAVGMHRIIDNDNGQRSITAAIAPLRYKTPFDGDARGSCLKRLGYVKRKRHLVTHAIGTRQRDKFL